MAKIVEKISVQKHITIYKQSDSIKWYARLKINGQYIVRTTGTSDKDDAKRVALVLFGELSTLAKYGHMVKKKKDGFKHFAKIAIKRIKNERPQKAIYPTYINVLNKYHIPFFNTLPIKQCITDDKLEEFYKWQVEQLGRQPAKSTINTYNTAFLRVLEVAVKEDIIKHHEIPKLDNYGRRGERRAAFTKEEYKAVVEEAYRRINIGKKAISKQIKLSLYYYIQLAALTGMRPGTEIEYLTWSDIDFHVQNPKKRYLTFKVRRGKTTKHTGTREVVCRKELNDIVQNMIVDLRKGDNNTRIFQNTKEYGANFSEILKTLNLKESAHGKRTLYSLRHSYITWALQDGIDITKIASQCGTSIEMIQKHYSWVVPLMFAGELSGELGQDDEDEDE